MGSIYKRGKTFWVKYYRNGKPYFESAKSDKENGGRERTFRLKRTLLV